MIKVDISLTNSWGAEPLYIALSTFAWLLTWLYWHSKVLSWYHAQRCRPKKRVKNYSIILRWENSNRNIVSVKTIKACILCWLCSKNDKMLHLIMIVSVNLLSVVISIYIDCFCEQPFSQNLISALVIIIIIITLSSYFIILYIISVSSKNYSTLDVTSTPYIQLRSLWPKAIHMGSAF